MHGSGPDRTGVAEERAQYVLVLRAPNDGRARNDDAEGRQPTQGVRRPLQPLAERRADRHARLGPMPLLSEQDRQTVQAHLAVITHRVTILFFTQTIGAPETVLVAKQVI